MNRPLRLALAIIALLACVAGAAWAQAAHGTVRVVVRGQGGPAAGLRVVIESSGDSRYNAAAQTDAQGAASFADVPLGEVSARVYDSQEQFLVTGKGILEQAGQEITLVLDPEPAP
jgi:hypothetical protein